MGHVCTHPCDVADVCVASAQSVRNHLQYRTSGTAATHIEQFYLERGRAVCGTVGQGDCGLDLMCIMLDMKQCQEARTSHPVAIAVARLFEAAYERAVDVGAHGRLLRAGAR